MFPAVYPPDAVSLSRSRRFTTWAAPTPARSSRDSSLSVNYCLSKTRVFHNQRFFTLVTSHLSVNKFLECSQFTTRLWKSKLNPWCLSPPHVHVLLRGTSGGKMWPLWPSLASIVGQKSIFFAAWTGTDGQKPPYLFLSLFASLSLFLSLSLSRFPSLSLSLLYTLSLSLSRQVERIMYY